MAEITSASNEDSAARPSQFVSGVVVGLVLGTAGYYFLGTPEGKRLHQTLKTRWQKFAKSVETQQGGAKADWSDRLQVGLRLVAKELGVAGPITARQSLPKARTTHASASVLTPQRSKTKTARSRAKFKGV